MISLSKCRKYFALLLIFVLLLQQTGFAALAGETAAESEVQTVAAQNTEEEKDPAAVGPQKSEQGQAQSEAESKPAQQDVQQAESGAESEQTQSEAGTEQDQVQSQAEHGESGQDQAQSQAEQGQAEQDQAQSQAEQGQAEQGQAEQDQAQSQAEQGQAEQGQAEQGQAEQDQTQSQVEQSQAEQGQTAETQPGSGSQQGSQPAEAQQGAGAEGTVSSQAALPESQAQGAESQAGAPEDGAQPAGSEEEVLDFPEEVTAEDDFPAQEFTAEIKPGMKATVTASAGLLPKNTKMELHLLKDEATALISQKVSDDFTDTLGFELLFYDEENYQIQPYEDGELQIKIELKEEQKLSLPILPASDWQLLYLAEEKQTYEKDPAAEGAPAAGVPEAEALSEEEKKLIEEGIPLTEKELKEAGIPVAEAELAAGGDPASAGDSKKLKKVFMLPKTIITKLDEYGAEFKTSLNAPFVIAVPAEAEPEETIFTETVSDPVNGGSIQVSMTAPRGSLPCPGRDLSLAVDAIAQTAAEALVEDAIEDAEDVKRETLVFDIRLLKDGAEIEPVGPVSVTFSGIENPNDDAQIFHVDEEAGSVEEMPVDMGSGGELIMDTEHFSKYAVTYTVESYFRCFSGETFKITVSFDESAQIPAGTELYVRELLPGTEEYESYLVKAAEAIWASNVETVSFARFFEIELRRDGAKIEPKTPVQVKIEYTDGVEREEGDRFSVIHFAENGTEVIQDVDVNENLTEISYEQESFSITATLLTTAPHSNYLGDPYALIAEYDGQYYMVLSDGTLEMVSYDEENNTITSDHAAVWDFVQTFEERTWLRYLVNGYDFDYLQLPTQYAYTYIDPSASEGISTDQVRAVYQNGGAEYEPLQFGDQPKTYTELDSPSDRINLIFDEGRRISTYKDGTEYYLGVDSKGKKIAGGLLLSVPDEEAQVSSVSFYLAQVEEVGEDLAKKHYVNHIEASIEGQAEAELPLARGDYYFYERNENGDLLPVKDESGNPKGLEVTDDMSITVSKKVAAGEESLRQAKIETFILDQGVETPIDDVFYISGISSNLASSHQGVGLRFDGVFKVANLDPLDSNYSSDPSDDVTEEWLSDVGNRRLANRIYYRLTAVEPNVYFDYEYTDPDTGKTVVLCDKAGNPQFIKADVTLTKTFDYWDDSNECPHIRGNGIIPAYTEKWRIGGISMSDLSGMDFALSCDPIVELDLAAVEINNYVVDTAGNPLSPEDYAPIGVNIYESSDADADSAANLNIGTYTTHVDYSTYGCTQSLTMYVDEKDGDGQTYGRILNYGVSSGMVCIEEDSSSIPDQFTDEDGNIWIYKGTYIETKNSGRSAANEGEMHVSDFYTKNSSEKGAYFSVPEVLGPYTLTDGTQKQNTLQKFSIYNVYEKPAEPAKKETTISRLNDSGNYDAVSASLQSTEEGQAAQGGKDLDVYDLAKPGDRITYTITFKNYKSAEADAVVTDQLDPNVTFVSAEAAKKLQKNSETGAYTETGELLGSTQIDSPAIGENGTVVWTISGLEPGAEGYVELTVEVTDGAAEVNRVGSQASVKLGTDGNYDKEFWTNEEENPVPKEPQLTEIRTAGATAVLDEKRAGKAAQGGKDLEIYGEVSVGDEITYEIAFKNYKSSAADVVINNVLDQNVTFVSATEAKDAAGAKVGTTAISKPAAGETGTVTWIIEHAAAGAEGSVELTVKVAKGASTAQKVDNQASVKVGAESRVNLKLAKSGAGIRPGLKSLESGDGTSFDQEIWTNEQENPVAKEAEPEQEEPEPTQKPVQEEQKPTQKPEQEEQKPTQKPEQEEQEPDKTSTDENPSLAGESQEPTKKAQNTGTPTPSPSSTSGRTRTTNSTATTTTATTTTATNTPTTNTTTTNTTTTNTATTNTTTTNTPTTNTTANNTTTNNTTTSNTATNSTVTTNTAANNTTANSTAAKSTAANSTSTGSITSANTGDQTNTALPAAASAIALLMILFFLLENKKRRKL